MENKTSKNIVLAYYFSHSLKGELILNPSLCNYELTYPGLPYGII
jgi:hypothetical protein